MQSADRDERASVGDDILLVSIDGTHAYKFYIYSLRCKCRA